MFSGKKKKMLGAVLIAVGAVLIIVFVPFWLWVSVIGVGLITVGVALCVVLVRILTIKM